MLAAAQARLDGTRFFGADFLFGLGGACRFFFFFVTVCAWGWTGAQALWAASRLRAETNEARHKQRIIRFMLGLG